ncbi:nitrogenase cofactor biosynthesis protein NifB [Vibrio sp. JC009]|uniref:nitrogenase cofactor biosynthesis protein NifB n=1 Tax=Vibrio sp. JC009 TaxID=2912314 RepID=UPI0023AE7E62|nr:nitrogenase cofactor biosynthesis protein NifB [Vibrio sp. JC009]WED24090.1 nitrogenase cofactor biosynthesis protein NifB [Vibrio sp. JC009]
MDKSSNHSTKSHSDINKVSHFFRKEVRDKIASHPCYSKNAHKYARMHLPVAPACNIQCNYCNRKYDCSNESRPGVVSNLTDPYGALKQFRAVSKRSPNLSVVGIAGPGDALANPKATFTALKLIREESPEAQLCISTNGLALAEHIDSLVEVGVNHLTITINCIDPEIGKEIYPWIYYDNRRIRGVEAASILIERQLAGLEAASQAGMLIKVNTVLIPGINDHHIQAVSEKVRGLGAMLHNIMPLISDPAHGTYFGLTHQRGPTDEELQQARSRSGDHMPQMTHCQQCRADAVGTLGQSCSSGEDNSSANKAYKVAVAGTKKQDDTFIQTHFGHAEQFDIYEYSEAEQAFVHSETRIVSQYCTGADECISEEEHKQQLIDAISDVNELFCSRIGISPWQQLENAGVKPNVDFAYESLDTALQKTVSNLKAKSQTYQMLKGA